MGQLSPDFEVAFESLLPVARGHEHDANVKGEATE